MILVEHFRANNLQAFTLVKIVLGQSINLFESRGLFAKIILSSWMLSFIIMQNFYCAKLWDFMTFDHYGQPIETIDDLIQSMISGKIKMIKENYKTFLIQYLEVNLGELMEKYVITTRFKKM